VKVRRGGVGTHFCIHKYFFDRSPSWKAIRDEEIRAEDSHQKTESRKAEFPDEEEDGNTDIQSLDFTPIDARHLSSLPLIRARVVKLLKASRNQMHASNNMLITLVCPRNNAYLFWPTLNCLSFDRGSRTRLKQIVGSFRVEFAK
jgi:hypothetical protein